MALFVPRDRKQLFRQFLAGMYDAVVITDPNGHIIELNPRAVEYFGYDQESLVDRPIAYLVPGIAPDVVLRIRRGLASGSHMVIDAAAKTMSGERFACEVTISMIDLMDPDDLVFTIRNIERRRRLHAMLRSKEAAFELSRAALFACDTEGRITQANHAFLDMFTLASVDEACQHSFVDFLPDDPLPENFKKALAGETTTVGVVAQSDDGGKDEEVEVSLGPVRVGRKLKGVAGSVLKVG